MLFKKIRFLNRLIQHFKMIKLIRFFFLKLSVEFHLTTVQVTNYYFHLKEHKRESIA